MPCRAPWRRRCRTASRPTARAATRSSPSVRTTRPGMPSCTSTCSRVRAAPGPATTDRPACPIRDRTTRTCRSRSPESTYPLHFNRYGIVEDSASPGRWRGSPALVREFVYLGADSLVQVRSDKREHLPFGLAGGAAGRASMTTVDHAGEVTVRPVMGPSPILAGDVFRHELSSGAGWGDPLDRDPAAVLRDVRNGVVSVARAMADHGVGDRPGRDGGRRGDGRRAAQTAPGHPDRRDTACPG